LKQPNNEAWSQGATCRRTDSLNCRTPVRTRNDCRKVVGSDPAEAGQAQGSEVHEGTLSPRRKAGPGTE